MDPDDSPAAPSLLYVVKRLELAIRSQLDQMLAHADVTTLQYTALTVLEHHDGISAARLARASFVTPQAMADMLRALEQHRLIERLPNPASRRERLVHLTDDGRRLVTEYAEAVDAIIARMTVDFDADEVAAFRRSLTRAWAALGRAEAGAG